MATETIKATAHEDYKDTIAPMRQIRDCVQGAPTVKKATTLYLPPPWQVTIINSTAQQKRYDDLILNAEFDNDVDDTRRELIGKMRLDDLTVELPSKLEYLEKDIDGDGTSLKSSIELAVNNVLQTKYQMLVADYQGLSGIDLQSVSIADAKLLNARATVKQYTRENIVNWYFSRINGVMQLTWVMLLERGTKFNADSYTQEEVESYLILGLDDEGYYQQKVVYGGDANGVPGEKDHMKVTGKNLNFIPCAIVADEELEAGCLPQAMGYLYGISDKVLQRYRVSALYKECQKALLPTTYTKGWKNGDADTFQELNGRSNIESGAYSVNALPRDVEVTVESASSNMDDMHWYFEQSKKQVSEMGGKSGAQSSNMTATEANIIASAQNALLDTIATSEEVGFKRVLSYCAMFEGLVKPEAVNQYDDIDLVLPRDFGTPKMGVDEVQILLEMRDRGVRTTDQVIRQLADGGWDIQDAEDTINELENDGGNLNLPPVDVEEVV